MKLVQHKKLLIAIALAGCALTYFLFSVRGVENSQRLYINSVILTFNGIKNLIEADLEKNHLVTSQENLRWNWAQSSGGNLYGVSNIIFSQKGEVVVLNETSGIAVVLKPSSNPPWKWMCSTYPKMDFDSLCLKL